MNGPKALVTGASRGIGKALSLALAHAGYDVAITARRLKREHAPLVSSDPYRASLFSLAGSLEETAELIGKLGRQAFVVAADLTDEASVNACAALISGHWGALDLIVHNGRYIGPGLTEDILTARTAEYRHFVEAHAIAPVILTRHFLPTMLEKGRGQILNITSNAAFETPPGPPGEGSWSLPYAMGKAAGHVLVGSLHAQFHGRGIEAFNLEPGYIATERNQLIRTDWTTSPRSVEELSAAVLWLLTAPARAQYSGRSLHLRDIQHLMASGRVRHRC